MGRTIMMLKRGIEPSPSLCSPNFDISSRSLSRGAVTSSMALDILLNEVMVQQRLLDVMWHSFDTYVCPAYLH